VSSAARRERNRAIFARESQPPIRDPVRIGRVLARFLTPFCIGVVATLAWQSCGDAARQMIASWSPRLCWLAAPAAPITEAVPAAPSLDHEELNAILLSLGGVRQRVDEIAAQLAVGQGQMTRDDITNKANEQEILEKPSAPAQRPAATSQNIPQRISEKQHLRTLPQTVMNEFHRIAFRKRVYRSSTSCKLISMRGSPK
jgi:hypothetical protein